MSPVLIYHTAAQILPPILHVLLSPTKELRSSALSLLSCVAETSPLSLLPFLYQIMDYVRNLLLLEKSVETRRGAVVFLLCLLRGLRENILTTLDSDGIEEIRTRLRIVEANDEDELTRIHARTALADLNDYLTGASG